MGFPGLLSDRVGVRHQYSLVGIADFDEHM